MSVHAIREIAQRLSLRAPQHEALATTATLANALGLPPAGADPRAFLAIKQGDREAQLAACHAAVPSLASFDRGFPSFCFALATGVGKTRLMGAQIAYLHRVHGAQHFFVVAPNLTIYDKLRRDFTPNTPKYVFEGLPDFATRVPELITGDDWDTGRGVRGAGGSLFGQDAIHVNLFNVAKFDTVDGARMRSPRETIGGSYFEYLASLPDLVVLMDESHRYRARAAAAALNELSPLLGIELTATPQVQQGTSVTRFTNVAYDYPLGRAIADGFVKKPAVAGRLNLDGAEQDVERLDRMKLEDAIVLHEQVKAELIAYADREGVKRVKPFVLVIARDTTHAHQLEALISSSGFHNGLYAGRVITVHSNRTGAEKDEVIQRLLRVEDPTEPTEIVIHVEMLKEGWDVTNLYTVVPLRAANSRTLVEQSIGRGLRLPYGRHTGVAAVDRLTIVAHDKFNEIVAEAESGSSPFAIERVVLDATTLTPMVAITTVPIIEQMIAATPTAATVGDQPVAVEPTASVAVSTPTTIVPTPMFSSASDAAVGKAAYEAVSTLTNLPTSAALLSPAAQAQIAQRVAERLHGGQIDLGVGAPPVDVSAIVRTITSAVVGQTIDVPRIVLRPTGETTVAYDDVPVDPTAWRFVAHEHDIVVRELQSRVQVRIAAGLPSTEARVENYIIRRLADESDLDYDGNAELFQRRASEIVAAMRQYETDEGRLHDLVATHDAAIAQRLAAHLRAHRSESPTAYVPEIVAGWAPLAGQTRTVPAGEPVRNYREPVVDRARIRQMRFVGFQRCLFHELQFQSDGERRFAIALEDHPDRTLRWFRPGRADIRIFWSADNLYQPDFIVETTSERLLVEIKAPDEVDNAEVQAKARAAVQWCAHATAHSVANGGKPWRYLLIPDEAVQYNATLDALAAQFALGA